MGRKKVAEREGIGEEVVELDENGLNIRNRGKNCLLTNGVLPLIQTDRLALESIGELSEPLVCNYTDDQYPPPSNQNPSTRMSAEEVRPRSS
jgi:hypothetical protein